MFTNVRSTIRGGMYFFLWSCKRIRNQMSSRHFGLSISLKLHKIPVAFHQKSGEWQKHKKKVEHWLPSSASCRWTVCHLILYLVLEDAGYKFPDEKSKWSTLRDEFAKTTQSKVQQRFHVYASCLCPTIIIGKNFHHRTNDIPFPPFTHNAQHFHSSETYNQDKDGMVPDPQNKAHQIWCVVG